jgi:hypothetical protein
MNSIIIIILGILLILSCYFIYKLIYKSNKGNIIQKQISLSDNNSPIMNDKLTNPYSNNFAFGVWIYINTWSNLNKTIFYLHKNGTNVSSAINPLTTVASFPDFSLGLDSNAPKLYCTIGAEQNVPYKILLTDKFPIQKWTYVVLSLEGNILDSYIDGKLVISKSINFANFIDTINKIGTDNIYLGDCDTNVKNDIYITSFNRWDHALDPNTVYNLYLNGNGLSNMFSNSYNIDIDISKNNTTQKQIRII